jgi:hypothetical protein
MFGKSFTGFVMVIGLLLLVIGSGVSSRGVSLAGDFLFALGLIYGGMSLSEEHAAVRVAMIAIGGLAAIAAFISSYPVSLFS